MRSVRNIIFLFLSLIINNAQATVKVSCHTNDLRIRNYVKQTVLFNLDSNETPKQIQILRSSNGHFENSKAEGVFEPSTQFPSLNLIRFNVTGIQTGELMKSLYFLNLPKGAFEKKTFKSILEIWLDNGQAGWISLNLDCYSL
jgi:hypothetical protein